MTNIILITGHGSLYDAACAMLMPEYTVIKCLSAADWKLPLSSYNNVSLALIIDDGSILSFMYNMEDKLRQSGIPSLRVFNFLGESFIGPFSLPKIKGCFACADKRLLNTQKDRVFLSSLNISNLLKDVWLSATSIAVVTALIRKEVDCFFKKNSILKPTTLHIVNLLTLQCQSHSFLPVPTCARCGNLPEDTKQQASVTLRPCKKANIHSFRHKNLSTIKENLFETYLDSRTGMFNVLLYENESPFPVCVGNLPISNGMDEPGIGRALNYRDSEAIAILEGLERYAGMEANGKKVSIYNSYTNLQDIALDPRLLGTHSPEQYAATNFPFPKFNPQKKREWVWGYSFLKRQPILVPEVCAYYGYFHHKGYKNAPFYEISNGCALGGSLEEAILHGIFEVIERDSFLITWYAQLMLPALDVTMVQNEQLQLMINRFVYETGYELFFFNMTLDTGIPAVLAIARNKTVNNEQLYCLCAAGCNLDPVQAVKNSIHEISGIIFALRSKYKERRQDALKMLHNPNLVKNMEDHSLVNALPEAADRLAFLLDSITSPIPFDQSFSTPKKYSNNLTYDLKNVIKRVISLEMDIIMIDQTTEEMRLHNLFCVKVLIPGTLSMTFGHSMKRVWGLKRVLQVPYKLGFKNSPLTLQELNPHPHPFP